jgi:glycosyltransferase involved in cell wall biosynthesis
MSVLPFVSICTPTFNRRPFIPHLINSIELQTYDKTRIEWVIVDDGTDKIEDLVSKIPYVKYHKFDKQMTLGRKRNLMHTFCKGDIIVYMDDDDYYPCERVEHAVSSLLNASASILCAGSSALHIYFDHIQKIYQFGPYKENHSTAATMAFKKELLLITQYDESNAVAEEQHFLKNYTIPLVQLDPLKTILVFSHIHNSVDKKKMLESPNKYMNLTTLKPAHFFKGPGAHVAKEFYVNQLNKVLSTYDLGTTKFKPDLMNQIQKITDQRKKTLAPLQEMHDKMTEMRLGYETIIEKKDILINALIKQNKELKERLREQNDDHNQIIK